MRIPLQHAKGIYATLSLVAALVVGCDKKEEESGTTCAAETEAAAAALTEGESTSTKVDANGCPVKEGAVDTGKQPGGSDGGSTDGGTVVTDPVPAGQPPAAFSIAGTSGVAATAAPQIAWSAAAGASTYSVQVSASSNCASPLASASNLTATSYTPAGLPANGTFHVCVAAQNAAGSVNATNSGSFTFTIDTTGPAPLQSFSGSTPHDLGALVVNWQAAASYADYATLKFRFLTGATPPADCNSGSVLATYTSFSGGPIGYYLYSVPGTVYSFRACLYDALGNVTTSPAMTISSLTASTDRKLFVTSVPFNGNLKGTYNGQTFNNGYDGADYRCQHLANAAGQYGTFKAVLSSGGGRDTWAWTRVGGAVYNVNGTKIADDKTKLLSYNHALAAAPSTDETGAVVSTDLKVWSGHQEGDDDGPMSGGESCSDWSSSGTWGYYGNPTSTGGSWAYSSMQACSSVARLYCIQQESKPAALTSFSAVAGGSPGSGVATIDFPANTYGYHQVKVFRMKGISPENPNCDVNAAGAALVKTYGSGGQALQDDVTNDTIGSEGYFSYVACTIASDGIIIAQDKSAGFQSGTDFQRMFITSNSFDGDLGGLAGADQICQDHADFIPLGGTWKAVLSASGGGNTAASRIAVSKNIFDLDGNYVANSSGDLWDSKIGGRGVRTDEYGTDIAGGGWTSYWTGATGAGGLDSDNCQDWSYGADSAFSGSTGEAGKSDIYWITFSGSGCNSTNQVLCIDGQ